VVFKLGEEKRSMEFSVSVVRGDIELRKLIINGSEVRTWKADKYIVRAGEEVKCSLDYGWRMGERYSIQLLTDSGQSSEIIAESQIVEPKLTINMEKMSTVLNSGFLKFKLKYEAHGYGIDSLHILLFTYSSFINLNRNICIFYDPDYMTNESINRADSIVRYFSNYGIDIYKMDYHALELWSKKTSSSARKSILILVNPLKDNLGRRISNIIPAPLVDLNENGFLKDDSRYGKSFIYDLMMDDGLVLVTIGSLQPYKRILYRDGIYTWAKDSSEPLDAHLFFTSVSDGESIIKNLPFIYFDYSPVRISGTLGLSYIETSTGFDKVAMEGHGLEYYAYGDYRPTVGEAFNLSLPIFIRVGKGGWLALGDEQFWLKDEELAHDLFMIYLQGIWDSKWIPYGWYWDSGCAFYNCHGELKVDGELETEFIPSNIIRDKLVIRIIGIAYSSDLDKGTIVERIIEYDMRGESIGG
jgi:hypothetical protein